ncbi:MAG: hypothetical protein AABZ60_07245, partial [Planctomycetota bacterium]
MAKPQPRKKSKAELQENLEKIRSEQKAAKTDGFDSGREQQEDQRLLQCLSEMTVELVASQISTISLEIPRALGQISAQLIEKFQLLGEIERAIEVQKRELKKLHDMDIVVTSLEQLLNEFENKKSEIEAEVAQRRQSWLEEGKEHEQTLKDQEELLKKQRAREKEDFEYQRQLERKKDHDKY